MTDTTESRGVYMDTHLWPVDFHFKIGSLNKWHEEQRKKTKTSVKQVSFISHGLCSLPSWQHSLAMSGFNMGPEAQRLLHINPPEAGMKSYDIEIIPLKDVHVHKNTVTRIHCLGLLQNRKEVPIDAALELRRRVTDDLMKQWGVKSIIVMHKPVSERAFFKRFVLHSEASGEAYRYELEDLANKVFDNNDAVAWLASKP